MNPVRRIGRYMLPILNVVAIAERRRTGWHGWLMRIGLVRPGYDVLLVSGHTIYFTEDEKTEYDGALQLHVETLKVYGMCKGLGLRT